MDLKEAIKTVESYSFDPDNVWGEASLVILNELRSEQQRTKDFITWARTSWGYITTKILEDKIEELWPQLHDWAWVLEQPQGTRVKWVSDNKGYFVFDAKGVCVYEDHNRSRWNPTFTKEMFTELGWTLYRERK